ncbi:MAG: 30S ribosomal protein S1 [Candidatus Omnitrophica bacterium]|nr:30S ribosomal protein S1 [Candidatus Omnitrophota bacterium]
MAEFADGSNKQINKKGDDFSKIYEESLKDIKEGQILKGRIIAISKKEVLVDVGYKSEGLIPLNEFPNPGELKVGDEIEVFLEQKENEEGMMVISKEKADKTQSWERIIATHREGDIIEGRVTKKVKGGLTVDIGIEAFLPASQTFLKAPFNIDSLLGQTIKVRILKINKARKNIVVSRKEALQFEREHAKSKILDELRKGEIRKGVVKNITDFGAFIDLGGVDGLLHITDMSWSRISHPSEMLAIGDPIEVMILDFDKENIKVSLGLKQKTQSPWQNAEQKYPVGSKVKGKVVNILPYGVFVELEKGLEGLIHVSEISWSKKITNPQEMFAIGDAVEAVVIGIDSANQKLSLGIKQLEANPWVDAKTKYPVGTVIKGKIRNLTDYGAFVELEEGIDGLIHISDMSWTKRISNPSEILKKGQRIEAVVLNIDPENRKLSLGLKQLTADPWPDIIKKCPVGTPIEGRIVKITTFGLFVEFNDNLEGLLHISELETEPSLSLDRRFKVGDSIKALILKIDEEQRKIALTSKGLSGI